MEIFILKLKALLEENVVSFQGCKMMHREDLKG